MQLTMEQFSFVNNLPNVSRDSCVITVNGTDYSLVPGSYKLRELVDAFNALGTSVTVSFLNIQNRMSFRTAAGSDITVSFQGYLGNLFGLRKTSPSITVPANGAVTSPFQVIPRLHNEVVISLRDVSIQPLNITNMGTGERDTQASSILGIVPVTATANDLSVFINQNNTFTTRLYATNVDFLSFEMLDADGNPIADMPDWTMVIRCETHTAPKEDPMLSRVDALLVYVRLIFMMIATALEAL
jgi:hypothetical protein